MSRRIWHSRLLILYFVFEQFTKREPEDTKSADSDRDVFNEKPSKEEVMAATQAEGPKRVSDSAIIHTTMGDIHIKLFPVEYVFLSFDSSLVWDGSTLIYLFLLLRCPKTVENFCVHSRNSYYNGHIFHRVIKVWAPVECLVVCLRICGCELNECVCVCAGLHDPDRRPDGHRDGWRKHLGWRVWGRVSCHTEARQTLHAQHGQRRPGDQWVAVFHHCRPNCKTIRLHFLYITHYNPCLGCLFFYETSRFRIHYWIRLYWLHCFWFAKNS